MTQNRNNDAATIDRIQQNVLARSERRLLNWLCAHMPRWVTPDLLTSLGIVGALAIFVGYAASLLGDGWLWLAIAGYVIQWFGDSLDGSLARYRRIERPKFGYFIDHSCDGLTVLLILGGIGVSPYVHVETGLLALVGYLLLSIHAYLSVHVMGEMKLSYLAAGPTELRLILITMTLLMMALGPDAGAYGGMSGFDLFVGGVGVLLIVLFIVQTIRTAGRLRRAGR